MLLDASFNKLGFYHLARFTSLCYGKEKKITPVKSLTRMIQKTGRIEKAFCFLFLALGM